jgi:hypothetical protein
MPESKHIHELISDVVNLDGSIAELQRVSDACCPTGPKCKRALACARTQLDQARHWLADAMDFSTRGE